MERFNNIRLSRLICLLAAGLAVLTLSSGVQAGGCLSDLREDIRDEIKDYVRLRDYLCTSDHDPDVKIRVQIQRINEMPAGVLLAGGKATSIDDIYGKKRKVLPNEVLSEYKTLIKRFGTEMRWHNNGARFYRLPDVPQSPLIDETLHILNERTWPSSLNMYYPYDASSKNPLAGMTVWRYLSSADIKDYDRRIRKYKALLGIRDRDLGWRKPDPKSVQMVQYLTANGWPENFLIAVSAIGDMWDCPGFDLLVWPRYLQVDVAVVENLSRRSIALDQFKGSAHSGKELRAGGDKLRSPLMSGRVIYEGGYTLGASEKLIIPLRIVFSDNSYSYNDSSEQEMRRASEKRYRRIVATKPKTIFRADIYTRLFGSKAQRGKEEGTFVVRKVRESFKAPKYPEYIDFVFGPEWSLSGFAVDSERILFSRGPSSPIDLTAGSEAGSCPILYAWDDKDQHFWRWGKVIHRAQSRAQSETQSIRFDGWVSRFRISEEELELTHLSKVRAFVVLEDGAEHEAMLEIGSIGLGKEGALLLAANEAAEFSFSLPVGIAPEDVRETRLAVTGYYERYSTLLAKRVLEQRRPQNMTPMADALR